MEVKYLVSLYIDPAAADAMSTFGGGGRLYLMGCLNEALSLPPKSMIVHFHPAKPSSPYHFNTLRLWFFLKGLSYPADAYVSVDTDIILTERFHPTVVEIFSNHACFAGVWELKGNRLREKWYSFVVTAAQFAGVKPMPYKIAGGLVGAVKPIWENTSKLASSWFFSYYLKHPELRDATGWGATPTEEHFLTAAFSPYYFDGSLKIYSLDFAKDAREKSSLEPFPDPTLKYCSAHSPSRALVTAFLKERLKDYANIKVKDALKLIQDQQILLTG